MMMVPLMPKAHGLAITSMVTGILAVPACCCWPVAMPLSITAVVTGIMALGKIKANPHLFKGGGMAIAGIICASVSLLVTLGSALTHLDKQMLPNLGLP
jgi:hypothetical protein